MADESSHESNDEFEKNLEDEVARASNDASNAKAIATELGNVFTNQFTALAEHLQQGFSSLERTMTNANRAKRKRKSSSSSASGSESGTSSDRSEQDTSSTKKPKQAKISAKDDLTEQVEDLINTQDGGKSNISTNAQDGVLNEMSQELDCDELCGPPMLDKLATVVNKMLRTKLSEDKLKEKQGLYTRPQNCETLVTTRVNAEIWSKLQSHTRSVDIRLQKVQALLLKGIVPILRIANTQLNSDGGANAESHKEMTRQALDAISLLSQANQELNQRRRELIKPDLNEKYQQICAEHVPCTDLLFGDDLHKTLQEITATNRVSQQFSGPPAFKKNLNSNRSKNERGRWHYPPRHFHRRRGGGRKKQTQ